ncbi:GHKL domain-containing protein [Niallia nealsonii]|uniref:Histidine kinase n=1 Tax=Niallia nealsonii TaxID=115979 RepID=A0A2N0Z313_9BACI|nr:GHKL domain-containing protein [Niallia nealsonii]PKG23901.1 histidine kinase [Niallia nealsonii]
MRNKKIRIIIVLSIVMLLFFICLNLIISYMSMKNSVEEAIANQNLKSAKSIAESIDTEKYETFLENPVRNKEYWEIRHFLNDSREKIGALYVYTLKIDNNIYSKDMIIGVPNDVSGFPIGERCTVPTKQVRLALEGKDYTTGVLNDPKYGDYLSVGVPIKDENQQIIGYLGIDISTELVKDIEYKVLVNSTPIILINILFVFVLLIAFFIMNRWYHKELQNEINHTEDTYQKEVLSLMSSVHSFRHDYLNHIQVVQGLLKIGNQEQALQYANQLLKEANALKTSETIVIGNPALSVLLQTKKMAAQNRNIIMEVKSTDTDFMKIKSIDIIKILSNLIDNSMDAAEELPESSRKIFVSCEEKEDHYVFRVSNTGPLIANLEKIFEKGYTTKKYYPSVTRGFGLSIVKETVERYKGTIQVDSNEEKTTFIVTISLI